jgi:hypothetical protein
MPTFKTLWFVAYLTTPLQQLVLFSLGLWDDKIDGCGMGKQALNLSHFECRH